MTMTGDFTAVNDGHVRLAVLRLLDTQPQYSANDSVLTASMAPLGLACTRDQMRGHLSWLAEQRLVKLTQFGGALTVAILTERGGDVAAGRSSVHGVARPSPRGD
jgi:hypothetical protein